MSKHNISNLIIAGPCAAESREQVISLAKEVKKRGILAMRACLWKPRTKPGFDGVGTEGIPWLLEAAAMGLTICTEVLTPDHVSAIVKNAITGLKAILWIGSRNQNHLIQKAIAERILKEAPAGVKLMIKNQPWEDEIHWLGIVEHILASGFPKERLLLCHRGFVPNGHNPHNLRNVPNWEMALRVREKLRLPMIVDPSHMGGSAGNVLMITKEAKRHSFDGFLIEVNIDPSSAKTDAKQQLSLDDFDRLLKIIE